MDAQSHGRVSAGDQLVGDTKASENLQSARLDRQRAGLVDPVQAAVDETRPDAGGGQLRGEGQPGRSGADHEHLGQAAGHDVTVPFVGPGAAARADRAARPG